MSDGQSVYWEEWGVRDGVPALYLHGGPGSGLSRGYRNRFDLTRVRLVGIEQRGCGRSTPLASSPEHDLDANTTERLIADIEEIREARGIARWLVNGVSWGSTLAIAYALAHPDRVTGIVLIAVTTTSRAEVDWITEHVGAIYPEHWERFASHAEHAGIGYERGRGRLVDAYATLMRDPAVRDAASHAWAEWEDAHIAIGAGTFDRNPRWEDDQYRRDFVILTTHYWSHDGFASPPLLDRIADIGHIPAVLIHGRLDVSGPLRTAWEVHRRWPASRLVVDELSGHGSDTMAREWSTANDAFTSSA